MLSVGHDARSESRMRAASKVRSIVFTAACMVASAAEGCVIFTAQIAPCGHAAPCFRLVKRHVRIVVAGATSHIAERARSTRALPVPREQAKLRFLVVGCRTSDEKNMQTLYGSGEWDSSSSDGVVELRDAIRAYVQRLACGERAVDEDGADARRALDRVCTHLAHGQHGPEKVVIALKNAWRSSAGTVEEQAQRQPLYEYLLAHALSSYYGSAADEASSGRGGMGT